MEYPEGSVDLKEGINMQDLQDPNKGAQFEVEAVDEVEPETSRKMHLAFDGEEIFNNLLNLDEDTFADCERNNVEPFEALERKMADITEAKDGGVLKRIVKQGTGSVVPPEALVRVHYNAYQEGQDEPFDSTRLRQRMEKFRLGIGNQVEGVHVAVGSMKKGERSQFIIKPEYFFGKLGCPPRIPPNCTVLFELELLSFVEREGVEDWDQMTEEERKQVAFEFVCKVAKSKREEANQEYNGQRYGRAFSKYKEASRILEDYHLKNQREEEQQRKHLLRVNINMAMCCLKMGRNGMGITYCNKALDIDENNVKAIYHKAQALRNMCEFDDAKKLYFRAQRLDSANRDIVRALRDLDKDIKKYSIQSDNYQSMCKRMMSGLSTQDESSEDTAQKEGESDSVKCSERFRTTVEEKMSVFCEDPHLVEMPFPEQSLTVPEIACIVEVAGKLGLTVQRRGTGNATKMVVQKRRDQLKIEK